MTSINIWIQWLLFSHIRQKHTPSQSWFRLRSCLSTSFNRTNIIDSFPPLLQKCKSFSFRRITLEEKRFLLFFRRHSWTFNRNYNDPLTHLPGGGSRKARETQTPMKSQGRTLFLATNSSHWCFLLYSHWRQLQRPSLSHCTPLFSGNSLRCFEQCLKKLQNGSSTRSAVTRGPWAEWVRNCLERPFQVCCRALCNLLSLGGGKACSLAAFMDSFFLQWWWGLCLECYKEVLFSLIISLPASAPECDQTWNTVYKE